LRQLIGGDGDVIRQTDFRRQQIVLSAVHFMGVTIVTDGQQVGIFVIQEAEIHVRMLVQALFEFTDDVQPLARQPDSAG